MKSLHSTALQCLTLAAFVHSASAFTIVSSSTRINGNWAETLTRPVNASNSGTFDTPSGSFLFDSPYQSLNASAAISAFDLSLSGHAAERSVPYTQGPNGTKLVASSGTPGYFDLPVASIDTININALATTRFTNDASTLTLGLRVQATWDYFSNEQDVRLSVKDLATSAMLMDLVLQPASNLQPTSFVYNIPVQPFRQYELIFGGSGRIFDGKDLVMTASLAVQGVPDGGSVLAMFASAAVPLLWLRRIWAAKARSFIP